MNDLLDFEPVEDYLPVSTIDDRTLCSKYLVSGNGISWKMLHHPLGYRILAISCTTIFVCRWKATM